MIERAKQHLSAEDQKFDTVLSQLEDLKLQLKEGQAEAERLRATAQDALSQAREERDKLIRQGQAELEAAREKARRMAADVERQAYDLLDELRKLEKDKTRAASQRAARAREIARKDSEKLFLKSDVVHTVQREYTPLKKAEPGQEVYLVELDKTGIVSSRPDKDGLVEVRRGHFAHEGAAFQTGGTA